MQIAAGIIGWQATPPPRDGNTFIAHVGYPWPVVSAWSDAESLFVFAALAVSDYQGKCDPGFETEWAKPDEVLAWMPLPDVGAASAATNTPANPVAAEAPHTESKPE